MAEGACNTTLHALGSGPNNATQLVEFSPISLVAQVATSSASNPLVIVVADGGDQREVERFSFIPAEDVLTTSNSRISFQAWCHLQAFSAAGRSSLAACSHDAISGIFLIRDQFYTLRQHDGRIFIVPRDGATCDFHTRPKRAVKVKNGLPDYYKKYLDRNQRYVELALFADKSMHDFYKEKTSDRLKTIALHVNSLYSPLRIDVRLIYQEIWTDADKVDVLENGDKTLEKFVIYRKSVLAEKPNDNAHLLTRIHFEDGVVGKAYKGTMCSLDYSGGVDVDHQEDAALVAATVAHEMGHNFGMGHDPIDDENMCECKNDHCLMHPTAGYSYPAYWSECSLRQLFNSLERGVDFCLHNQPGVTVSDPNRCGNGVVDPGEECDCGAEICPSDCCIGKTCQLRPAAECAAGGCCDLATCKRKPRSTVCRHKIDICDLPEYCNGETDECPANFFIQDGHTCPGYPEAFCYNGQCGSRNLQCETIWGPESKDADAHCYDNNISGSYQGNCGTISYGNYSKCPQEDVQCGRLQCNADLNQKPILSDAISFSHSYTKIYDTLSKKTISCKMVDSTLRDQDKELGIVKDGAVCGKEKVCLSKKCTKLTAIRSTVTDCLDHCYDRGVCNNVGNCHCDPGYGGVSCGIPGYGGSVNSNPADYRAMSSLVIAGIILGFVFLGYILATIWFYKKKKIWLPGECWKWTRDTFNLRGVLVPVRKAPPPPGGGGHQRMKRFSLNMGWGDHHTVTYRTAENSVPIVHNPSPPITLPIKNPVPDYQGAGSSFPATAVFQPNAPTITVSRSNSLNRPTQPPPGVPSRPRDSALQALYEEHGAEMGIRTEPIEHHYVVPPDSPAEKPPPPIPKASPVAATSKIQRSESMNRPPTIPPPPPPVADKPKFDKPSKPTISAPKPKLPKPANDSETDTSESQPISEALIVMVQTPNGFVPMIIRPDSQNPGLQDQKNQQGDNAQGSTEDDDVLAATTEVPKKAPKDVEIPKTSKNTDNKQKNDNLDISVEILPSRIPAPSFGNDEKEIQLDAVTEAPEVELDTQDPDMQPKRIPGPHRHHHHRFPAHRFEDFDRNDDFQPRRHKVDDA
ncbi:unnamed protein product, partial [Mesorhabditis spiculigera]